MMQANVIGQWGNIAPHGSTMGCRRFLHPSVKDSFEIAHELFISVTNVHHSPITRTFRDCDHELLQSVINLCQPLDISIGTLQIMRE